MISIRLRSVGTSSAQLSARRSSESSGASGTVGTTPRPSVALHPGSWRFRAERGEGRGEGAVGARGFLLAQQNSPSPDSGPAQDIRTLWWWMLGIASVVFLGAVALLVVGWVRRRREGLPLLGNAEKATTGLVVVFGMVIPIVVLSLVFVFGDIVVLRQTDAPAAGTTRLTVRVVGHQWWWEVRYPGSPAVTANEIHIPVGVPVRMSGTSADVIHSFWVPELNRKVDFEPGYNNSLLLEADRPGRYRGQCAEFCGLQHAHMSFWVIAEEPARFRAWLDREGASAAQPSAGAPPRGGQAFMAPACSSCHHNPGPEARGPVRPALTPA